MKGIAVIIAVLFFSTIWSQSPTAAFNISALEICAGKSITFTDNSSSSGNLSSWNWTFNGGSPGNSNTQGPHTVYFYSGGTYPIKLQVGDDNGNFAEVTISVTVHSNPSAYASNNGPLCSGNSVTLSSSSPSGGGLSYTWSGPNGFSASTDDVVIPYITISQFGLYTVEIENSYGCTSTASTDVLVADGPDLVMSGTDVTCNGATDGIASVSATNGSQPYFYTWYPSGSNTYIATNLPAGMHYVNVLDGNNCVSKDSILITEPPEIFLNSSTTPSQCYVDDGSASVTASGGNPGYTYSWLPYGGNSATATSLGPGEYVVTVEDASGCERYDTVQIEIDNEPVLSITDSSNISCFGQNDGQIEATINGGTPNYSYNWSPPNGGSNVATGLSAGEYLVSGVDDNGCETDTIKVIISEPDSLIVDTTVIGTTCGYSNGEIILHVSGGTGNYSYQWSNGLSTSDIAQNLSVGTYNVIVSDSMGCAQSLDINIDVVEPFGIDITPETTTIHKGDSVDVNVNVDPNINIGNISWTPSDGLSCNNCFDPTITPSDTTYYVSEVTSTDGCSSKDSILIVVKFPCGDVFVPTIFSPDGDGVNDFECIRGRCIISCDFTIFNRWGEAVFQTTDSKECWDGTYKGKMVESGVYVYKLIAEREDGETVNKTGNITVVR